MNIYAAADSGGNINQILGCPASMSPPAISGMTLIPLPSLPASPVTWIAANYVSGGTVAAKRPLALLVSVLTITADGTGSATIGGLPDPSTVTITGAVSAGPETVTDGSVVITSDTPGEITVSVSANPAYLPWSAIIDAV